MVVSCSIYRKFAEISTQVVHTTQCGHLFHYSCLNKWMKRSESCPNCRSLVTEGSTIRLHDTQSCYNDTAAFITRMKSESEIISKDIEITMEKLSRGMMELKVANKKAIEKRKAAENAMKVLLDKL